MLKWFEVVLVHPSKREVARLPPLQLVPTQISDADFLIDGIRKAYGIEAVILKRLDGRRDQNRKFSHYTYALRSLSPQLPERHRWTGGADADEVFAQINSVQLDQPWSHPEWWPTMQTWVKQACLRAGLPKVKGFKQNRAWDLSAVVEAELEDGAAVFYKAVPRAFAAEPALTSWLAATLPSVAATGRGPEVIAMDNDQRCILMRACKGARLDKISDLSEWERVLRAYAAIQKHSLPDIEYLTAIGVPRRSLNWLPSAWNHLRVDRQCLQPGSHADLSDAEIVSLNAADGPQVAEWITELENLGVPDTLEHGDFHALNVFAGASGTTIIDWTDAAITHPFLSLACFLRSLRFMDGFKDQGDVPKKLAASYLSNWTTYASHEELLRILPLVIRVSAVFQAVHYRERLNPLVDKYQEIYSATPSYVRDVLATESVQKD